MIPNATVGAGASDKGTLRVILASDSPGGAGGVTQADIIAALIQFAGESFSGVAAPMVVKFDASNPVEVVRQDSADVPSASQIDAIVNGVGVTTTTFSSVATSAADGTAFVALPNVACKRVFLVNDSNTALLVDKGSGTAIRVPSEVKTFPIDGITNANQLRIKRADEGTSSVTITFQVSI
jgi:hypothetical protein